MIMGNVNDLAEERMAICKKCPLYKDDPDRGEICNPNKYLSPDGEKYSYFKKDGWVKGCSCHLPLKWARQNSHCPAKKW